MTKIVLISFFFLFTIFPLKYCETVTFSSGVSGSDPTKIAISFTVSKTSFQNSPNRCIISGCGWTTNTDIISDGSEDIVFTSNFQPSDILSGSCSTNFEKANGYDTASSFGYTLKSTVEDLWKIECGKSNGNFNPSWRDYFRVIMLLPKAGTTKVIGQLYQDQSMNDKLEIDLSVSWVLEFKPNEAICESNPSASSGLCTNYGDNKFLRRNSYRTFTLSNSYLPLDTNTKPIITFKDSNGIASNYVLPSDKLLYSPNSGDKTTSLQIDLDIPSASSGNYDKILFTVFFDGDYNSERRTNQNSRISTKILKIKWIEDQGYSSFLEPIWKIFFILIGFLIVSFGITMNKLRKIRGKKKKNRMINYSILPTDSKLNVN